LSRYQDVITARQQYYQTREKIKAGEQTQLDNLQTALMLQAIQTELEGVAALLHLIPVLKIGAPTTDGTSEGGPNLGSSLQAFGSVLGMTANALNTAGTASAISAGYDRRQEEWYHQADLATKELAQVAQQIAAAQIRVEIATKELDNHNQQIENASEVDSYYHDKFTNEDLYDWMVGQISAVYFQSYQLAYDLAKRAERCFQFELGDDTATFIHFGYWDSLKKGLLAGEQLQQDLRRMEIAYLDQNRREHEITKHISLASLDPIALLTLKETGTCFVSLPEVLFDMDYPGHYLRRIKSVSLTLPCVTGPYTSINCTLTLLSNKIRTDSVIHGSSYVDDNNFRTNFAATQSIATSHAQNDSGMFELNFRDERYLPFEGAGAIAQWRIELPRDTNAFDFNTLTDVVLRLQYTARDGGQLLAKAARDNLTQPLTDEQRTMGMTTNLADGVRLFSAKHEFAASWIQFLNPTDPNLATLQLDLSKDRFPFQLRGMKVTITTVKLFLVLDDLLGQNTFMDAQPVFSSLNNGVISGSLTSPNRSQTLPATFNNPNVGPSNPVLVASVSVNDTGDNRGTWGVSFARSAGAGGIPAALAVSSNSQPPQEPYQFDPKKVQDLLVVCEYTISS
jgi:hypothetical protein